ncbi:EAL domain-containing protein [uncultured Alsobacter sp.]|uniref:EAL domain-containing response regulator n=1 Tax=uncultured Alsobacter sp. TaxID=1748258 RepID=UPI0025DA43FF|nr:EAL domain-containing response regulator [uncultured Alsobacter sp.]
MPHSIGPDTAHAAPPLGRPLLIVDDDRTQRLLLAQVAQRCGFVVDMAASVAEAVDLIDQRDHATVILDLSLGEGDGVEVLRHLAAAGRHPSVLVISGFDERIRDAAVRFAMTVGLSTVGTLRKPLSLAQVREHLLKASEDRPGHERRPGIAAHVTADDVALAIEAGEIRPVYQPKVHLATGRLAGVEALARWNSPRHGVVPPDVFVGVAEQAGLATALTRAMLRAAVRDAATWEPASTGIGLAVNVPPFALDDLAWPDHVEAELAANGVPPGVLTLEVTESTLMADFVRASDILTRLRIKGVALALDDFGTGYSSLLSLLRLPFSELKLDRSFVQRCDEDPYALKIVRAMLSLAREFGMSTVAEGIESQPVADLLRECGCDLGQGYFFSRPISLVELQAMIGRQRAA